MKWKPLSAYSAVSDCGRYHVSVAGPPQARVYDAWFGTLAERTLRSLYTGPSKQAAIQACIDDAAKLTTQPRPSAA